MLVPAVSPACPQSQGVPIGICTGVLGDTVKAIAACCMTALSQLLPLSPCGQLQSVRPQVEQKSGAVFCQPWRTCAAERAADRRNMCERNHGHAHNAAGELCRTYQA